MSIESYNDLDTTYDTIERHKESIPVSLDNLCSDLGIKIERALLHEDTSGYISFNDGKYIITVNGRYPYNRRRFTIAHEIGHFLYDKDILENRRICDDRLFRAEGVSNVSYEHEARANRFAASLLMPEKKIREYASMPNQTLENMAEIFRTSRAAMNIRLESLGITLVQQAAAVEHSIPF